MIEPVITVSLNFRPTGELCLIDAGQESPRLLLTMPVFGAFFGECSAVNKLTVVAFTPRLLATFSTELRRSVADAGC